MPIIALSRRKFPALPRHRRVTASGSLGDAEQESADPAAMDLDPGSDALPERQHGEPKLDALFAALDDDELAGIEEMATEDLEAFIEQLQEKTGAPRRRRSLIDVAV